MDGSGGIASLVLGASTQPGFVSPVAIDANSVDGLLGVMGNTFNVTYSGLSKIRLLLPSYLGVGQSITIASPSAPLRIDGGEAANTYTITGSTELVSIYAGNGGNTFNVLGNTVAYIQSGSGADMFYVGPGVTLDGEIHYGFGGNNTLDIQGTVTGYVGI